MKWNKWMLCTTTPHSAVKTEPVCHAWQSLQASGGYLQKSLLSNTRCGRHPGPTAPQACEACRRGGCGKGGEAPSLLLKTFEFFYQFLNIFQHSKMQLFNSRCHHMWAIPCVHCNYHQTNQNGKTIKLNILPCTCIHMYFQPKYKSQITN